MVAGDTVQMYPPGAVDRENRLRVLQTGFRTVVGFAGGDLPPEHALGRYLNQIQKLIKDHGCRDFRFDLSGMSSIPSGLLGVLTTLANRGLHASICHAEPSLHDVFELANFGHCLRPQHAKPEGNGAAKPVHAAAPAADASKPAKAEWMGTIFTVQRDENVLIVGLGATQTYRPTQLHAEADALRRKLGDPQIKHLVFDMNGVNYVGSEVIGILVGLANVVKGKGCKVAVCRVSMRVREMLESIGILKAWPQSPTREAAVKAVNRP